MTPKPPGYDTTYRTITVTVKSDSEIASPVNVLASFFKIEAGELKVFRGVPVVSSTSASEAVFTTSEDHGFAVRDRVTIYDHAITGPTPSARNAEFVVLSVPSATTFSVGFNSTTEGAGTGGLVGKKTPDYFNSAHVSNVLVDPRLFIDTPEGRNPWEREYFG